MRLMECKVMSLQYTPHMAYNLAVSMMSIVAVVSIPVNPPKIVLMGDDEFTINLNEMERWVPYGVAFGDSRYVIWKNDDDALVMIDTEMLEQKPNDR